MSDHKGHRCREIVCGRCFEASPIWEPTFCIGCITKAGEGAEALLAIRKIIHSSPGPYFSADEKAILEIIDPIIAKAKAKNE